MRRPLLLAAALLLLAAAPPAFAASSSPAPNGSASSAPAHGKRTFTVGLLQDVDSLNPFIGVLASAYEIYQLEYDTLTGYSQKDFSATPGLASSWTTSADGLTWTYRIRSGIKWSDGVPLTARDAAYTFDRIIKGSFEQTNYGNYVANIASATAPDDTTLVLKTKVPSPTMLHLAVYILPAHIWKNIDEKQVQTFENDKNPVTSGPFRVVERKVGQFTRLAANKAYWAGAPKIDELVFRIFNNGDAMVQALKKGEIDFIDNVQASLFNSLKSVPGITRVDAKYSGFNEIGMNTGAATDTGAPIGNGHPALKDKVVRQAINLAIDRQGLVNKVLGGYGTAGSSIVPPLYGALHYQPGADSLNYNPTKANAMLDAAGYARGGDGIRRMPGNGRPLSFRLFGRSDSATSKQSVAFVQGYLKDVGIATKVSIVAENRLTEVIGNGEYDLFEWGWVVEPDPDYQLSTFTCGQRSTRTGGKLSAGLSDSFYCNPAFDALYARQKTIIDVAQRTAVVKQAQQLLYDDAPYAIEFYYDNLEAYRSDRFTGFQPQPDPGGSLLFQYGTYSYRNIEPVVGAQAATGGRGAAIGIALAALAAVLVAGGALVLRRRSTADERE